MIVLRLIALLAAGMVLIVPPLVATGVGHAAMPGWIAVSGLTGVALVALSFFYIAALGDRMRRSRPVRTLGGLLLLIPAAAGIAMLATRTDPDLLWAAGLLLSFTVMLFVSFVYPAVPERRQRRMRRRERSEPALILVQRHPSTERRTRVREGSLGV
jgi:membrane protein implicated in regulation of membrane protease activity